jgi:hypothetical protein
LSLGSCATHNVRRTLVRHGQHASISLAQIARMCLHTDNKFRPWGGQQGLHSVPQIATVRKPHQGLGWKHMCSTYIILGTMSCLPRLRKRITLTTILGGNDGVQLPFRGTMPRLACVIFAMPCSSSSPVRIVWKKSMLCCCVRTPHLLGSTSRFYRRRYA